MGTVRSLSQRAPLPSPFIGAPNTARPRTWAPRKGLILNDTSTRQPSYTGLSQIGPRKHGLRALAAAESDAAADLERETRIRNNLVRYWKQNPGATAPALVRMLAGRDRKEGAVVAEKLAAENSAFPAYQTAA